MTSRIVHWVVNEFDTATSELVAEYPLMGVRLEDLRRVFQQDDDADMIEVWPLDAAKLQQLEPFLARPVSIRQGRSYYVECYVEA